MNDALSAAQIEQFVEEGFTALPRAFPRSVADEARAILWKHTGLSENEPETWTQPVIRLGYFDDPPFQAAANAPPLLRAFDQLVGEGRWAPRPNLGTFPLRFPSTEDAGDTGWHIDPTFLREGDDPNDLFGYRANVSSRGRALLLLFLFSDVGEDDAPTRLRRGSNVDIARRLAPLGEDGLSLRELATDGFAFTRHRSEALAVGEAGTVFLCHPFLVHAAQRHRGRAPKFMAQPPLISRGSLRLDGPADETPLERSIRSALSP